MARREGEREREGGLTYSAEEPNKCSNAAIDRERMFSDSKERFALECELRQIQQGRGREEQSYFWRFTYFNPK